VATAPIGIGLREKWVCVSFSGRTRKVNCVALQVFAGVCYGTLPRLKISSSQAQAHKFNIARIQYSTFNIARIQYSTFNIPLFDFVLPITQNVSFFFLFSQ
jgi:hypothetical protein